MAESSAPKEGAVSVMPGGAACAVLSCDLRGFRSTSRSLIDALAWFARAYPGDIAYLHGVGPDAPDELARAEGSRDGSGTARSVGAAREEAPVRARYAMLGMRSYRRSHDAPHGCALDGVDLGAIGYVAYDDGDDGGFPSQWRWFDRWIVEDHATGTVTAIALGHLGPARDAVRELREQWESWDAAYAFGKRECVPEDDWIGANHPERRRPATSHDSFAGTPATRTHSVARMETAAIVGADQSRDGYMAAVRHMQRHMRDGDIYVANMSMRLDVRTPVSPIDAFRRLFVDNPSPYAAYLDFRDDGGDCRESADYDDCAATARGDRANASGLPNDGAATDDCGMTGGVVDGRREPGAGTDMGLVVVGSSPERFLRIWDGVAVTEPIKGTRPRGRDAAEDARLAADLHASAKEQAELLMVTDLERNDMNRFCEPGSVIVPAYEEVRAFPHVFHTVSVVEGRPRAGTDVADALRVMSPGGSITGTPKRRAMEIIGECERSPRGVYTGSLGYVGVDPAAWLARTRECAPMGSGAANAGRDKDCVLRETDAVDAAMPQVCDLSIVIRTAVMMGEDADADGAPRLYAYRIGAGGGVTLESDPAAEWDEAVHKARAILAALGVPGSTVDAFAHSHPAPLQGELSAAFCSSCSPCGGAVGGAD